MKEYRIRETQGEFYPEIKYTKLHKNIFGKVKYTSEEWHGLTFHGCDWDKLADIYMLYPIAKFGTKKEAKKFIKNINKSEKIHSI